MTIDELKGAKKLLIVTPDHLNFDIAAAFHTLAEILNNNKYEVTLLTNLSEYNLTYEKNLPKGELKFKEEIKQKDFVFEFPTDREIEDIEVDKVENKFRIVLKTKSGSLVEPQISFQKGQMNYDLVILLGIQNQNSAEYFFSNYEKAIAKSKLMALNYSNINIETDYSFIRNASSLCETALFFVQSLELDITKFQATNLLAGIFWNTQHLKVNTSPKTVESIHYLVNQKNAHIKIANSKIKSQFNPEQIKWYKQVFDNFTQKENFCYAILPGETLEAETIGNISSEDRVPFMKVYGCEVGVVLFNSKGRTHGFIQSETRKYPVLKIAEDFLCIGDDQHAFFSTDVPANEVLQHIQLQINGETSVKQSSEVNKSTERTKNVDVQNDDKASKQKNTRPDTSLINKLQEKREETPKEKPEFKRNPINAFTPKKYSKELTPPKPAQAAEKREENQKKQDKPAGQNKGVKDKEEDKKKDDQPPQPSVGSFTPPLQQASEWQEL